MYIKQNIKAKYGGGANGSAARIWLLYRYPAQILFQVVPLSSLAIGWYETINIHDLAYSLFSLVLNDDN